MIKKKIAKELGQEVFIQALSIFLENAERDFTLLQLYIESQDYSKAKELSHKLIGTCEAIGVKRLPPNLRILDENLEKRYVSLYNLQEVNAQFEELKVYIKNEFGLELAYS